MGVVEYWYTQDEHSQEEMTDWEYLQYREHIEHVRHWEGDECADEMIKDLNRRYRD